VGHGPTNGSHGHDVAPWWHLLVPHCWRGVMVPQSWSLSTGPTVMTWRHGPTVVQLAGPTLLMWQQDPTSCACLTGMVAWSHQWAPHLTWPYGAESAVRSSPSDFYFIWQKKLLYGSLDPVTYCCKHKWVTNKPLTHLCCSLVCCFIYLVIKPNSLFYFPKKIKNPMQGGLNLWPVGLEDATFTTKPIKLLCSYGTCLFICTLIIFLICLTRWALYPWSVIGGTLVRMREVQRNPRGSLLLAATRLYRVPRWSPLTPCIPRRWSSPTSCVLGDRHVRPSWSSSCVPRWSSPCGPAWILACVPTYSSFVHACI